MRRFSLITLPLLTACYAHAPIEPAAVRPGTAVRARVTGAGADRIAPLLGTANARFVSGRLVDTRGDTLIVEIPTVMQATIGSSIETLHQRIAIPRTELVELETRRLDRLRTGAVVGGITLAVGAIVLTALDKNPGSEGPPGGGGGTDARVPVWRLRF